MSDNVLSADNQQERSVMHYELTPDYIVGLVDGEGYFSVTARVRDRTTYRTYAVDMVFGIKLSERDGAILEAVKDYFGCGSIYFRKDEREKFCNCLEYQVRSHRDIIGTIIPFFKRHRLKFPSKRKAFEYLCQIAEIVSAQEHLSEEGINIVQSLSKLMHQGNPQRLHARPPISIGVKI